MLFLGQPCAIPVDGFRTLAHSRIAWTPQTGIVRCTIIETLPTPRLLRISNFHISSLCDVLLLVSCAKQRLDLATATINTL